jgi:hypothetical protein
LLRANSQDVTQLISATVAKKRHSLLHIQLVGAFLSRLSQVTITVTHFSQFMTTPISHQPIKCSKWNSIIFCNLIQNVTIKTQCLCLQFHHKNLCWFSDDAVSVSVHWVFNQKYTKCNNVPKCQPVLWHGFYNCYKLSSSQSYTVRQFNLWPSKQLLKIKCTNSQFKPHLLYNPKHHPSPKNKGLWLI